MIFVDASALVAMLLLEPDADRYYAVMDGPGPFISSGLAVYETTLSLAKSRPSVNEARRNVSRFLVMSEIKLVAIGDAETDEAITALIRYGRGSGHPAKLNMGDCFAYACAKTNNAALLYKGDDFAQTDIRSAV